LTKIRNSISAPQVSPVHATHMLDHLDQSEITIVCANIINRGVSEILTDP